LDNEQGAEQTQQISPPPKPSVLARAVEYAKGYLQQRSAEKKEYTPADRAALSTARATWIIAIWTFATFGVGISQYIIFSRQLTVMENDKRPWLNVQPDIQQFVDVTEWNESRGIRLPLKFSMKNYGQEPAINVRVYAKIVVHPGNPRREELAIPQKEVCENGNIDSDKNPIGGIAIFPSETGVIEVGNSVSGGALFKNGEPVLFSILGCIIYTYGAGAHGQTGFRYLLGKPQNGQVFGLPFVEGVPSEHYFPGEQLLKGGFPKNPPKIARISIGELSFRPEDSGNYAK